MALSLEFQVPNFYVPEDPNEPVVPHVVYSTAYAKLAVIIAHAEMAVMNVNWYANEAARRGDEAPIWTSVFEVATDALVGNVFPAAYAHLKTLPQFAGAVDVLEEKPAAVVDVPSDTVADTVSSDGDLLIDPPILDA